MITTKEIIDIMNTIPYIKKIEANIKVLYSTLNPSPAVAVIVTKPPLRAVNSPSPLMVAIDSSSTLHSISE